jgi:uncharacterized SAM-binding protein YcdF (DUF218 family)
VAAVLTALALLVMLLLRYGGYLLTVDDPLPEHADVAIVLSGSETSNRARIAGAMTLLEQGRVRSVLLSVGSVSYYGEWLPDLVRRFVEREYGHLPGQVLVCEVYADSTAAELTDIAECLQRQHDWRSAIVVTSNYHARRTRMTIRANLAGRTPVESFAVFGIDDESYEPLGWWRHRVYAKTWLLEFTKLAWFLIERALPGGDV